MKNFPQGYLTPSELAKITGISKQLLLYYDNNSIFSPEYVDKNGYRYYGCQQYFTLQIILFLRKLGLSLKDISEYLKNKSVDNLEAVYKEKLAACQQKLIYYKNLEDVLKKKIDRLQSLSTLPINQILIEMQPEERLYVSQPISLKLPIKERITLLASHMLPLCSCQDFADCIIGFSFDAMHLLNNTPMSSYKAFINAEGNISSNTLDSEKKVQGLYLTIYCNASYGIINPQSQKIIKSFLSKNKLKVLSDIYIFPIRNYWSSTKNEDEIAKVTMRVQYINQGI